MGGGFITECHTIAENSGNNYLKQCKQKFEHTKTLNNILPNPLRKKGYMIKY